MDLDEFDNSSSHSERRQLLSRRVAPPASESEELDEETHDNVSNTEFVKKAAVTDGDRSLFSTVMHRRTSPSVSEFSEMKQRLLVLERQLASSFSNDDEIRMAGRSPGADPRADLGVIYENGINDGTEQPQMIPKLCERAWSQFMNKHTNDSNEFALDVLVGEPDYYYRKKSVANFDKKYAKTRGTVAAIESNSDPKPAGRSDSQRLIPNRIRINSTLILKTLKTLDEHIDATASMVMMRPFKFLVHYDSQIKDSIRVLEHQLALDPLSMTQEGSIESKEKEMRQETLQHMQALADFMELYLKPTVARLEDNSYDKIQFLDLWYIFKPGDDIHMPLRIQDTAVTVDAMGTTPETFQSRYNQLWRVTGTSGGRPNIAAAQNRNASLKANPFRVDCYYIDFHGRYFRPTVHTFEIMPFKGEREINSLDFYPVRYMERAQHQETLKTHSEKGKVIFDSMARSFKHFFYSGPTLMVNPCGCSMHNGPTIQEHIESEVIVDFKMALRKYPSWQPQREPWKDPAIERSELKETFPLQYWIDGEKTKLESTEYDQVYNDYFIDRERAIVFKTNEQIFAPIPSGWLSNESMVPEKDGLLLPGRVFAFVLRTRTFAPVWLWGLQPIKAQKDGLDNLQLKDNTLKNTLQALVKTHFLHKQTQHSPDFEYDIVRGKGRGLVILLHGAPGVGKTFTAESVAAANGQPLLQITCGDLGLKPREVDAALKESFHYAAHWHCVLLLDECDIFLTQRNRSDIKRNALVSIFLRVLEFYTGVLFLTTNRVGALDEAIKSRITWISYYPPLNWTQTREIWKTSIKRVEKGNRNLEVDKNGIMKYAKQHFKLSAAENAVWNGRRIQNAFKVATALAHWEAYSKEERGQTEQLTPANDDDHRRSSLTSAHFKTYASGTLAFDTYFQEATGFTDADRAYHSMDRADDYELEEGFSLASPGYDGSQLATFLPHQDGLRRASSTSLVPPVTHGRASSPNHRPQLGPRLSTSQLLQQTRTSALSRQSTTGTPAQAHQLRRRSSQLTTLSSPVMRRRPSNERRVTVDYDLGRQSQAEYDDTGVETEETDYPVGHEPADESSDSDN